MSAEHPAFAATEVYLLLHHHARLDGLPVERAADDVEGPREVGQRLVGVWCDELQSRWLQTQSKVGHHRPSGRPHRQW